MVVAARNRPTPTAENTSSVSNPSKASWKESNNVVIMDKQGPRRRNVESGASRTVSPTSTEFSSLLSDTAASNEHPAYGSEGDDDSNETLGHVIPGSNDQRLTLMEEIVLLGLKDQQGYLSFLNDSISYVLRGCILMELAFRRRIRTVREPNRRPFPDRLLEVIDGSPTGEVLLDEALRLIKSERNSISAWLDLLSGETWNPLKVGYQLKQVRERIAKGLVDKGVLRTEKHSFFLFDMATHPLSSPACKEDILRRAVTTCMGRGPMPTLRAIALVTSALTANVLESALGVSGVTVGEREGAMVRAEDLLRIYSNPAERNVPLPAVNEIMAGVLTVFNRLDSLIY